MSKKGNNVVMEASTQEMFGYIHVDAMPDIMFRSGEVEVSLAGATPAQFDEFIGQYFPLEKIQVDRKSWPEEFRWRVVNYAIQRCGGLPMWKRVTIES